MVITTLQDYIYLYSSDGRTDGHTIDLEKHRFKEIEKDRETGWEETSVKINIVYTHTHTPHTQFGKRRLFVCVCVCEKCVPKYACVCVFLNKVKEA